MMQQQNNQAGMMALAQNPAAQNALKAWLGGMQAQQASNTQQLIQPDSSAERVEQKGRPQTLKEFGHDLTLATTMGAVGSRDHNIGHNMQDAAGIDQIQRAYGKKTTITQKPIQLQNNAPQLYWGQLVANQGMA